MPQDGSNNYQYPPGTPGIPDTTIESEAYNTFLDDLVTNDLNIPRPVHRGGTGATTAHQALINLNGEEASQQVTNYDSFPFVGGSFYSDAGATGAPTAGVYVGICYMHTTPGFITLEARSLDDATNPGALYVRQKRSGTWGSWAQQSGSKTELDADYVNITGDTMTGLLTLSGNPSAILHAATKQYVDGGVDGVTGGLAGKVAKAGDTMTGGLSAPTFSGTTANVVLGFNGAGNVLLRPNGIGASAGEMVVNTTGAVVASGNVVAPAFTGTTTAVVLASSSAGNVFLRPNGVAVTTGEMAVNTAGAVSVSGYVVAQDYKLINGVAGGFRCKAGDSNTISPTDYFNFYYTGNLLGYANSIYLGSVTFASDYRIKKDVTNLPSTWDTVKALRPIRYTQAEYTPPTEQTRAIENGQPFVAADNIERWGFIAHELQQTLIQSAATAEKDAPNAIQSPNPWTMLAATVKALQEAQSRIELLEAKTQALEAVG